MSLDLLRLKSVEDVGTIDAAAETLVLPNGHGLTSRLKIGTIYPSTSYPTARHAAAASPSRAEDVLIHDVTGDNASIKRGFNGTTPRTHNDGGEQYRLEFVEDIGSLRSANRISVATFGVLPENTGTENQAALDQMFAILPQDGVHLFFPAGVYEVNPTSSTGRFILNGFSNFRITGYGATLRVEDGNDFDDGLGSMQNIDGLVFQSCSDGVIEGLTWDANIANRLNAPVDSNDVTPNYPFDVQDSCHRLTFRRCRAIDSAVDGFAVQASSRTALATLPHDIVFEACSSSGHTRVGFSAFNCWAVSFIDCIAEDGYEGFDCEADTASPSPYVPGARDIRFIRCRSRGNTAAAISVGSSKYTSTPKHDFTQGVLIQGCDFDGRDSTGAASGPAKLTISRVRNCEVIDCRFLHSTAWTGSDQGVITMRTSADIVIRGCHFEGNAVSAKRAIRIDSECERIDISAISAPDHYGSHCIECAGSDVHIHDCVLFADAASGAAYGINANGSGANRCTVDRVVVLHSRGTGIRIDHHDGSVTNCDIVDNESDGSTINYGIFVVGDRPNVVGNRIPQPNDLAAAGDTTRRAVRTNGADATIRDNWCDNSSGKYDQNPAMESAGTVRAWGGNTGDEGTISAWSPSVPANSRYNSATDAAITVQNGKLGKHAVVVVPGHDPDTLVVSGTLVADASAEIILGNLTGSALQPTSADWKVKLIA